MSNTENELINASGRIRTGVVPASRVAGLKPAAFGHFATDARRPSDLNRESVLLALRFPLSRRAGYQIAQDRHAVARSRTGSALASGIPNLR